MENFLPPGRFTWIGFVPQGLLDDLLCAAGSYFSVLNFHPVILSDKFVVMQTDDSRLINTNKGFYGIEVVRLSDDVVSYYEGYFIDVDSSGAFEVSDRSQAVIYRLEGFRWHKCDCWV